MLNFCPVEGHLNIFKNIGWCFYTRTHLGLQTKDFQKKKAFIVTQPNCYL